MVSLIYKVKAKTLITSPCWEYITCLFLGMWLCGLLVSGELFLWNRDKDLLKTAAAVPEVVHMITAIQGMHGTVICIYVTLNLVTALILNYMITSRADIKSF